ncbi:uncharacterized protein TNCV_235841 [Trichonephila clavipes]|nr:uncharacterized protein TNCV_235841 [Trichonephila clavipes]
MNYYEVCPKIRYRFGLPWPQRQNRSLTLENTCLWLVINPVTPLEPDCVGLTHRTYPRRWIGRGGPVNWPACSPDLSCLDFFLWGHMKSLVYASPVDSDEALVARIAIVAGENREMPGVFANVRHSLRRRCEACIFAGGRFFEKFL